MFDDKHFPECENQDPELPCICNALWDNLEDIQTEINIQQILEGTKI